MGRRYTAYCNAVAHRAQVAKPRLEPRTTLAYLAAVTQRSRLGTAVLLPALRQTTVLALVLVNFAGHSPFDLTSCPKVPKLVIERM
jgi:alkanesulfonate monooxygenase SsuD/methylene tetrahydromethanopterin reductase-like flavin-dependent oxidoreductase (luciferase family)